MSATINGYDDFGDTSRYARASGRPHMPSTNEIVARLWSLCHALRDDGVTYHQYVTELTYLLFLKMAKETKRERVIPVGFRWKDLVERTGADQLRFYKLLLLHLGTHAGGRVQEIYTDATTTLRHPSILNKLITELDALDWFSAKQEGLGDLYEGLLEKNASEKKSGAGQYFTPRALVETMVALTKPRIGEVVQDPAAGTGGFLVHAYQYMHGSARRRSQKSTLVARIRQRDLVGMELVPETHRLLLMNAMLHDFEGDLRLGDALSVQGKSLGRADVILTNPPFGTKKGGGLPTRGDFSYPTSNKQLAFLQHIYQSLRPSTSDRTSRAAVVVPDNVLFEEGLGTQIRSDLMNKCNLHTILRLPTGIFYAQGVMTNVLFFTKGRGEKERNSTKDVWIYDFRSGVPPFGRNTPLTREHFLGFEAAFGADPFGRSKRIDQGKQGRFRRFTRRHIADRGENLDISWADGDSPKEAERQASLSCMASDIASTLSAAAEKMNKLAALLGGVD